MSISFLFSEVKNQDKPAKGTWDFNLQKVWMTGEAGTDLFAKPRNLQVADDGTIYVYDAQKSKIYSFTNDGKFIAAFGNRGEGPGEVKRFMNAYVVKNTFIVADIDKLNYFSSDGKLLKSVPNNYMQRGPNHFLNEDEFIYFPVVVMPDRPSDAGQIYHCNLKTGEEKVLAEFKIFKGGTASGQGRMIALVIPPLTPMMNIGYDPDKIYYGYSSAYEITEADYNGKKLNGFSLDRSQRKVTKEVKEAYFKLLQLPQAGDMLPMIMKTYPDELTHFCRIDVHNNLVFVYATNLARSVEKQEIDIFSPDGKYLYNAFLSAGEGNTIYVTPFPLVVFKGDYLYAAVEDKDDEPLIAKFKVQMPKM